MKTIKLLICFSFLFFLFFISGCEKTYRVTFLDHDGGVAKIETVKNGSEATPPEISEPDGYEFIGWDKDYSYIKKDVIIQAIYRIKEYQVVFKENNGLIYNIQTVKHGESATPPDIIPRDGYQIKGWSEDISYVTSDLEVYPVFESQKFTINFVSHGGNEIEPILNIEYNDTVILPTPINEGYDFLGWFVSDVEGANNFTSQNKVTSDLTLHARWRCIELKHIIENGQVTIVGYQGSRAELFIPDQIEGYPVKTISINAFKLNNIIEKIVLPNSLKRIYDNAFSQMPNLHSIIIPSSVEVIGTNILADTEVIDIEFPGNFTLKYFFGEVIPTSITKVTITEGSTEIVNNAIKDAINVNELIIPTTVTSIGSSIIENTSIKNIDLSQNQSITKIPNYAFNLARSLEQIVLPSSITEIGSFAFSDAVMLKSIIIGENVALIGKYAFKNTTSLTSVTFNTKSDIIIEIQEGAFTNTYLESIVLPNRITSISSKLFESSSRLKNITMPDTVTLIGDYSFNNCSSLEAITLSSNLVKIGNNAFSNTILKSIIIPNTVLEIFDNAFSNTQFLKTITLSNSLLTIGNNAFTNAVSLERIAIPKTIISIGMFAFSNASSLVEVTFEEGTNNLKTISASLFYQCDELIRIRIPNGVTSIGEHAFYENRNLLSVELPNTLKTIGNCAFMYVSKLSNIEIPYSIESIGNNVFKNATSLIDCTIHRDNPFTIGVDVFSNTHSLFRIYVLTNESETLYKESGYWSQYSSIIYTKNL